MRSRPHILVVLAVPLLIALAAPRAPAQQSLPAPDLDSVFPLGGRAGGTFELSFTGDMLEGKQALVFSHPGITAEPVVNPPDAFYPEARPARNRFTVKVAPDVPPGAYEVRVANAMGVSNARVFLVGNLPETTEKDAAQPKDDSELNDRPERATELAVNSVANGRCDARGRDYYKFTASKGQRLIIHCAARRADSNADAVLTLYDAAGNVLARAHDPVRLDPVLDFTAPADGPYLVSVHDFLYKGGERYGYRLTLGTGPWVDFVDPPFAAPGAAGKHTVYGSNLPGGAPAPGVDAGIPTLERLEVTIQPPADPAQAAPAVDTLMRPTEAALHSFSYRLAGPDGRKSNPVRMALVTDSMLAEQTDNDEAEKAQPLTLPSTVLGQWEKHDDRDWYTFQARKGDKVWIDVTSQRLGLPTDPSLVVQHVGTNDKGETVVKDVAEADDPQRVVDVNSLEQRYRDRGDDPSLLLTAPQDGTYRVLVRDLYSSAQAGPRYVYLLSVRGGGRGDFNLVAYAGRRDPENDNTTVTSTVLRKGGAAAIDVVAFRREGFDGEIELSVEGLPPGVIASPARIGPWSEFASVTLHAAPDAPDFSGAVKVVGRSTVDGVPAVRYARSVEVADVISQENPRPQVRVVEHVAMAVRGDVAVPFTLQAGGAGPDGTPQVFRTARGGKLSIPVKSTRAAGFAGNIRLRASGLHPQIRTQEANLDAGTAERAVEIDTDPSAPTGKFTFTFRGDTQVKYKRSPEVAKQAEDDKARIDALTQKANQDSQKAAQQSQQAQQAAQQAVAAANRAEQQRQQAAQQSQQAEQRLAEAEKKAAEAKAAYDTADAAAKQAAEVLASAQASAQQAAGADEAVKQAAAQAVQQATTAATQAQQQAAQAKAAMDQATNQAAAAATQAKAAAEALAKMTEAKAAADVKVTETAAAREAAAEAATKAREFYDLTERTRRQAEEWFRQTREFAQERDVRAVFPSPPVAVEIVEAPFTLTLAPAPTAKAGGEPAEVTATIAPEFGFADEVRFDLLPPPDVGGLNFTDKGNMLTKGTTAAKLLLQVGPNVKGGVYECRVRARYQFNGRGLSIERPLTVTVTPADVKQ